MKFDVVISSPPYKSMTGPWEKHIDKHLRLLKDESYYGILSPAGTKHEKILAICKRFTVSSSSNYNNYIKGLGYPSMSDSVYCFIWKKN